MNQTTLVNQINDYITKYPNAFTPGTTMSYKQFRRRFAKFNPSLKDADPMYTDNAAQFVSMYSQLNKVLRKRGMYMKSSNYCQKFVMGVDTQARIEAYEARAINAQEAATTLRRAGSCLTRTGKVRKWRALTAAELATVPNLIYSGKIRY